MRDEDGPHAVGDKTRAGLSGSGRGNNWVLFAVGTSPGGRDGVEFTVSLPTDAVRSGGTFSLAASDFFSDNFGGALISSKAQADGASDDSVVGEVAEGIIVIQPGADLGAPVTAFVRAALQPVRPDVAVGAPCPRGRVDCGPNERVSCLRTTSAEAVCVVPCEADAECAAYPSTKGLRCVDPGSTDSKVCLRPCTMPGGYDPEACGVTVSCKAFDAGAYCY